jgi:hypothetical protein
MAMRGMDDSGLDVDSKKRSVITHSKRTAGNCTLYKQVDLRPGKLPASEAGCCRGYTLWCLLLRPTVLYCTSDWVSMSLYLIDFEREMVWGSRAGSFVGKRRKGMGDGERKCVGKVKIDVEGGRKGDMGGGELRWESAVCDLVLGLRGTLVLALLRGQGRVQREI